MMLGAFPGGVLGYMLGRCLSDAIFKYKYKSKKIPSLLTVQSRTHAVVFHVSKRVVFVKKGGIE